MLYSEVKLLILDMKLLMEAARATGEGTGCFVNDLNSLDCRMGCDICPLETLVVKLINGFPDLEVGPGQFYILLTC